ncbi:hypothetical protein HPP92_007475 [Vanilla planifolia]|uniref:Protein kinase domain-containing protein n=1 Tax=Vanilla planifolia TaxID=51239 RepID=A0A835V9N0_VANPL|nr:hypothetical protein HPP92_007475 [Vanilla planifolia]
MVNKFESLHNPFIKTDEKILFGDTFDHTDSNAHVDWISLREWIKQKQDNFNKLERLNLFKQVMQIMDSLHSEGIALLHLRPSFFVVSLTGAVNYIGSFSVLVHARNSMGLIIQDATSKSHLKRKQETERDVDFKAIHLHKNIKFGHDQELHRILTSPFKKNEFVVQGNIHPLGSRIKGRMIEGTNDGSIKANDRNISPLGFQESLSQFHYLEDRWYASPEVTNENCCTLASNIYSLGILFFEGFT